MLPYALGMLVFVLGPLIAVLAISLTNWSLLDTPKYVGAANYLKLASDRDFLSSLAVTGFFTLGILLLNITAALVLANLMNLRLPGIGAFRTVVFSPVVMPVVAWALVWKFLLQPQGPINTALQGSGMPDANLLFAPGTALGTVIVIEVLKSVGLNAVIFLSALQGLPREVLEASRLDGANRWQTYTRVILPLISPTFFLVFVITLIGALKVFTPIWVLTGGGPSNATTTLLVYMYKQGFGFFDFGYASVIAAVLFVLILVTTVLQWNLRRRLVFYEE
ncbi:carbohydrate ABC transporter permease [Deinococcus aquiradiocola]|uniref:Sugar ABC transporter permease n=1 Tax=Deinococcus aquiradiocola TaxID=393059 RepID=A0A917PHQ3_9DEIO|nr:sugar ABC transporter permease [Deinococcus aquiradiocola]GGJ78942.1 sugar ABC transporter permease [Deinococcus aquiradiocola]